jgi:hypothetical protein
VWTGCLIPWEVEFLLHSRVQVGCDSPSRIPYRCCGLLDSPPLRPEYKSSSVCNPCFTTFSGKWLSVSLQRLLLSGCHNCVWRSETPFFFLLYPSSWSKTFLKSDLLPSFRDGEQVRCVVWWVLGPKWPFLQSLKSMRVSVLSHLQAEERKLYIVRRRAKCRTRERRTYNVIMRRVRLTIFGVEKQ